MKSHYTPQISASNVFAAARHQKHKALFLNMMKKWVLGIMMIIVTTGISPLIAQNIIPIRTDVSGYPDWTDNAIGGTTYLQILTASSYTISPSMNFNNYTGETLNFKARTFGGVNAVENTIFVAISTDNGTTWTDIGSRTPSNSTLTAMPAFDLSSYSGSNVKVKFYVKGTNDNVGAGIDDISFTGTLSCDAPTTQASSAASAAVTATTATISWTKGNGSSSLVLIRKDNAVNGAPANNTSYQPNAAFGEGDEIGSGNYVAYTGDGNSFALSSLEGGTTYHIAVFTFNCSNGSELYLSTNPAVISFTTPPAQASGLKVICTDNNSATITWNPPSGQYDGVVIGMRQGTTPPHEISSTPASINANAIFGSGTEYGTGGGSSFVVYKGTENQVTVTGLTAGQSYRIRAYAYKGTTWATGQHTTSINNLGIPEVNALTATGLSSEVLLGWGNPSAGCFDEILIVAKAGSSLTSTPSGDGSAYLSSASFGAGTAISPNEFVIYKGVGIQSQITGLTNGTTYFFKAFVRRGNQWSSGTEISFTPANVTILDYADLAILGVNTNQVGTPSGTDEIIFVLFKDFLPNSALDFTDNGHERTSAGYWGTTEGVIRLTRNNTTLPAGTVIKVIGVNTTFTVHTNGAQDNNWTVSSLNGSSQFNLNSEDQVWFMQGGNWSSAEGTHKGTYSGKVLYGWTATGWKPAPGYASTSGSTLYPTASCSSTNVIDKPNKDKVKYTGPITAASKREWIARINNPTTNWTGYASNDAYNTGGSFGNSLAITPFPILGDQWIGDKSNDWFDCANWGSLRVPDENTDVVVNDDAEDDIVINGGTARVRSLHIDNIALDFAITGTDAATNLIITGNVHLNLFRFLHTAGTIELKGNTAQTFSGINPAFHKLVLNNPYGVSFGALNVDINGSLSLQQGMLSSSGLLHIKNTSPASLASSALNAGIKAELRRNVTSPNTYDFPLGSSALRQNAQITLNTATGLSHITASFNANIGNTDISSQNLFIETGGVFTQLHSLLDAGYWTIEPNAGASVNYNIELALSGATNTGPDPAQHTIVKRPHSGSNWNTQGTHNNNTQSLSGNTITAFLSGLTGFSDFAIAKNDLGPLPVELIAFTAKLQHPNTLLFWQTASEINNHFFAIERSANAQDFETIGMVYGNGTTSFTNSYSFTDTQPLFPVSYYRLRQTDFDGSTSYSSIVMITENISNSNKLKIDQLSFNQDNSLTMTASGSLAPTVEVRVINMLGRSTFSRKFDVSQPISIPAQYLQKSISLIEVSDGQQKDVRKISLP